MNVYQRLLACAAELNELGEQCSPTPNFRVTVVLDKTTYWEMMRKLHGSVQLATGQPPHGPLDQPCRVKGVQFKPADTPATLDVLRWDT